MSRIVTVTEIRSWPVVDGWSTAPDGFRVQLGDYARIGANASIGDGARIGANASIGDGATDATVNAACLAAYAAAGDSHTFVKWVTPDRMSPGWGPSARISYPHGAIIEEPDADPSPVQCARGLHVFRIGSDPAREGYCEANHSLISILVRVRTEDIIYAGGVYGDSKLRVRRLEVIS